LLDGEVLDSFTVEAGGEFAAFVTAPPSESQRVLSLMASHGDQQVASDASFILGATRIPVAVAEAETAGSEDEAQPEPAETAPASGEAETVGAAEESSENAGTAVAEAEADAARSEEETAQLEAPQTGIAQDETAEVETALAETAQTEAEVSEAPKAEEETPEPVTEAPQSVAVLRADSSGITVVQPGASGAADGVALDTLSYTDAGNVEIAGRARAGAALRIYVDNAAAGDLRSGADGSWTASLGAVAPGSYTLRVDEVDAQGSVVSRIETPFTREAPEVLAEAAPEADPEVPEPVLRAITVRKGDSLWAISRAAYGDGRLYVRLFDANRNEIKDPDLIYPGQVFALPE
jgi:nucleoid-associated protein YgaU